MPMHCLCIASLGIFETRNSCQYECDQCLKLGLNMLSIIIPKEFDQGFHNGKLWLYTYVHKIYPFFIWSDKGLQQRIAQSNYYQAYLLPKQVFSVDSKLLNDSHLALYTILSISLYAFCFYSLYKEMSCMSQ